MVSASEGHVYHNRLTHTLEVAQIARRLTEHLISSQGEAASHFGIDPEVVEAAALAHDIGHPPFGHLGEKVLDDLLKSKDPDGFESNAQSFRIVNTLAVRNREIEGLNLCRATLDAILKYPWLRGNAHCNHRKFGAYRTEEEAFHFARGLHRSGDRRKAAEAEIMDWADDVAYSVHDLDDFYRAGLIPLHILSQVEEERDRFVEGAVQRWRNNGEVEEFYLDQLKHVLNWLVNTVDGGGIAPPTFRIPYEGTLQQRGQIRSYTASLISRFIVGTPDEAAVVLNPSSLGNEPNVTIRDEARIEVKILKEITSFYVFGKRSLSSQQFGEENVIRQLFTWFHEAAREAKEPRRIGGSILPKMFLEKAEEAMKAAPDEQVADRQAARIAADSIASLTERQALAVFRRLSGLDLGSIHDAIF